MAITNNASLDRISELQAKNRKLALGYHKMKVNFIDMGKDKMGDFVYLIMTQMDTGATTKRPDSIINGDRYDVAKIHVGESRLNGSGYGIVEGDQLADFIQRILTWFPNYEALDNWADILNGLEGKVIDAWLTRKNGYLQVCWDERQYQYCLENMGHIGAAAGKDQPTDKALNDECPF